jgi:hypothetical protein
MDFMSGLKTPTKDGANSAVETPDTVATVMDNESVRGSPISQYCQNLQTINEELLRENKILKQELHNYLPKHGETPSTVLVVRHPNGSEYTEPVYAWELVQYDTKHKTDGLPAYDKDGIKLGEKIFGPNNMMEAINAESKKRKLGGKKCTTRRRRGGNKKSCKRTNKR